jgi:phosphoribosylamine---glycine ligase
VNLLIVGGGGREHALCVAARAERPDAAIFCAPGNPGTAAVATNLAVAADDIDGIAQAVRDHSITLTIVGPEAPLARGLADRLRAAGHPVFGPNAAAAQIEASKAFAKDVMEAAGVPTARSRTFTELRPALEWLGTHPEPLVVKASGLAAGKGAVVCAQRAEAAAAVSAMLDAHAFGAAGDTVIIEEFLEGEELSVFALTDGTLIELLPAAQDHKRLGENDEGPNTGGMGAYAPVSLSTPELLARVCEEVLEPTLAELRRRGTPFSGVLYAGLMIAPDGAPSVVEFNCRLGDPEAQVVLPLVRGGLMDCIESIANGRGVTPLEIRTGAAAVTTVLAAKGYPDAPEKGDRIDLPDDVPDGVTIYHAGTRRDADGTLRTAGGRVLTVTAVAPDLETAQAASRDTAEHVLFDGKQFRRDIGWREAERRGRACPSV